MSSSSIPSNATSPSTGLGSLTHAGFQQLQASMHKLASGPQPPVVKEDTRFPSGKAGDTPAAHQDFSTSPANEASPALPAVTAEEVEAARLMLNGLQDDPFAQTFLREYQADPGSTACLDALRSAAVSGTTMAGTFGLRGVAAAHVNNPAIRAATLLAAAAATVPVGMAVGKLAGVQPGHESRPHSRINDLMLPASFLTVQLAHVLGDHAKYSPKTLPGVMQTLFLAFSGAAAGGALASVHHQAQARNGSLPAHTVSLGPPVEAALKRSVLTIPAATIPLVVPPAVAPVAGLVALAAGWAARSKAEPQEAGR